MAQQATMRDDVRRLIKAFRQYAAQQCWAADDYRLFLDVVVEWGKIHCILVAGSIPGGDRFEWWKSVHEFLETTLNDDQTLVDAISVVVRTFDQVKQGGLYSISPEYVDADELLGAMTLGSL